MEELIMNNIIQMIKNAIADVVAVEGEIRSMNTYGNNIVIRFTNGRTYTQPMIGLFNDQVTLDDAITN